MDTEEIRREVLPLFVAEAQEGLATLERCLLEIERRPQDKALVGEIFRAAHTLKGNSATMGFSAAVEVTHALEDLLDRVRQGVFEVTPDLVSLLLRAIDVIRALIDAAAQDLDEPVAGQPALVAALRSALEGRLKPEASVPPAEEASPLSAESDADSGGPSPMALGVRVDLEKLDRMLSLAGEIAIARSRMSALLEHLGPSGQAARDADQDTRRLDREMQEMIMRARMVPLGPSLSAHTRLVRDLSRRFEKPARLLVEGQGIEADLAIIERLKDPLTHMVRNALDHGVESPEVRKNLEKPPVATVTLRAFHEAGQLVVQVEDDGGGLDRDLILKRAHERGLLGPGAAPDDQEILDLIFRAGFTTVEKVTEFSGRGVGMDVVRKNISELRGSVELASRSGEGTIFTIRLPLTLSLITGFLTEAGGDNYVIPLDRVVEIMEAPPDLSRAQASLVDLRGTPLPCLRINRYMQSSAPEVERETLVVVEHAGAFAGLVVDRPLGEAQFVVKPLGHPFQRLRGFFGSALTSDGGVALILDVAALLTEARRLERTKTVEAG